MVKTTKLIQQLYMQLYLFLAFLLLAYCILSATYTVIIGGMTFYFFANIILTLQYIFALRTSTNSRIYTYLGLIILIIGLLYTHGLNFLNHLKAIILIPSFVLTLFSIDYLNKNPTRLNILKASLLLGLLLLAYSQYYDLLTLRNYYDSLHNGESWQQFGSL